MNTLSTIFGILALFFATSVFAMPNKHFYAAVDAGVFQANFATDYLDKTDVISQNISESVLQNGYTGGVALGYIQLINHHYFLGGEVSSHFNSSAANYQSGAATAAFSDTLQLYNYFDFTLVSGIVANSAFSPYLKLGLSYALIQDNLVSPLGYTPALATYHSTNNTLGFTAGLGITYPLNEKISIFSEFNFHDYGTLNFTDFQNFTADYTHSAHLCSYNLSVGAAYIFNA